MHEDKIVDYVMVFMDVNDLKKTNDVQGHEKGDELLSDVSEAIVSTFPNDNKNGIVGRWGGDEFIACIFGEENKADEFIEEFKRKIAETSHTVSIGKAVSTAKEPKDPSVAVAESDSAMYIDKALFHHRNRRIKK